MMTDAVLAQQAAAMMQLQANGLKVAQQPEQAAAAVLDAGAKAASAPLPAPAPGKGTVVDLLA